MRTVIVLLSFFCLPNLSISQFKHVEPNVEIELGENHKEKTNEKIIKITDKYVFAAGRRKGKIYISKYDKNNLKRNWILEHKAEIKTGGIKYNFEGVYFKGDYINVIYHGFNRKSKSYDFIKRVFDETGKEISLTKFVSIEFVNSDKYLSIEVKSIEGDNDGYAIGFVQGYGSPNEQLRFEFFWLDNDFTMKSQSGAETDFEGEDAIINQTLYSKDNAVYMVITELRDKIKKDLYSSESFLVKFMGSGESHIQKVTHSNKIVNGLYLSLLENPKRLMLHGMYSKDRKDIKTGLLVHEYRVDDLKRIADHSTTTFSDIASGYKETHKIGFDGHTENFTHTATLQDSSGGFFLIYENTFAIVSSGARIKNNNEGGRNFATTGIVYYYDRMNSYKFHEILLKRAFSGSLNQEDSYNFGYMLHDNKLILQYKLSGPDLKRWQPDISQGPASPNGYTYHYMQTIIDTLGKRKDRHLFAGKSTSSRFFASLHRSDYHMNKNPNLLFLLYPTNYWNEKRSLMRLEIK